MNMLNSKFYVILEKISNFFLLNILWIFMCLPIVTFFPATTAMFGVLREWAMKKENGVFRPYFRYFKENFKSSFLVGIVWILVVTILYIDFQLISQFSATISTIFISLLFVLGIIVAFMTIYLFPVMVHYKLSFKGILKNSFFISMMYFPTTILSILIIASMYTFFVFFPVSFLIIFSTGSYLIFLLCYRSFKKIELLTQKHKQLSENAAS